MIWTDILIAIQQTDVSSIPICSSWLQGNTQMVGGNQERLRLTISKTQHYEDDSIFRPAVRELRVDGMRIAPNWHVG